ncbi:MAG: hypothetical protein JXB25_00725 [Deltaproteobacteria bacterium]|nr:hypothetical protein [Deltaproteobacteria bacterium]
MKRWERMQGGEIVDLSGHSPKEILSPTGLRECIMWELHPLEYPKCEAEMKIACFIIEAPVMEKIHCHLGLWFVDNPEGILGGNIKNSVFQFLSWMPPEFSAPSCFF